MKKDMVDPDNTQKNPKCSIRFGVYFYFFRLRFFFKKSLKVK